MKPLIMTLLGLILLVGALSMVERIDQSSAKTSLQEAASGGVAVTDAKLAEVTEAAAPSTVNIADFAYTCFQELRARNPRGRLIRLSANRLGDRCSAVVETREGSGRWLFDWRDGNTWVREGELVLPDFWPSEIPGPGIDVSAFNAEAIAARAAAAHAQLGEKPHSEWMYEVLWLPAPFARTLTAITHSDTSAEAGPYDGYTYFFDVERILDAAEDIEANGLYPMTRFELREDHSFKGALYESTALAEAAISLETDPNAAADSALVKNAEACMDWLHKANTGSRVLRVGISAERCFLTLENGTVRDDFYLLTTTSADAYVESPSLQIDASTLPNLLLDRSRVTMPRLRERFAQGQARPGGEGIDRIAIFWLSDERMLWQFSVGAHVHMYLDEGGTVVDAPVSFPITRVELDQGFPASAPVMEVLAE